MGTTCLRAPLHTPSVRRPQQHPQKRPSESLGEHSPSLGLRTLRLRLWAENGWYRDLLDDAVTSTQMMLLIRVAVAVVTGDVMEGGWEDGYY